MIFTPMCAVGTAVYLANNAGGFDVRRCPEAEDLARFVAVSCNENAELQRQLAAKQEELDEWVHTNKIDELQRQLAAVAAERDQLKTMLELADALRNHEKGITK